MTTSPLSEVVGCTLPTPTILIIFYVRTLPYCHPKPHPFSVMLYLATFFTLLLPYGVSFALDTSSVRPSPSYLLMSRSNEANGNVGLARRLFIQVTAAGVLGLAPRFSRADVSDGTSLPQGAEQFSRVIRLKSDLKVRKPPSML